MASLDLFGGAGGWGAHQGIDTDPDVALTRAAAGLQTLVTDVSLVPEDVMRSTFPDTDGIVASPPCPPFTGAGPAEGRKDIDLLTATIACLGVNMDVRREYRGRCADPRSILSVEPLRWVLALRPQWTAWEQVIGALPVYQAAGQVLADEGYCVWVGVLDAHDYGVPQNRRRAILMAHRSRLVGQPARLPRRVMGDVIDGPRPDAVLRMGRSRGTERTLDQPSPTIMFGKSPNDVGWYDAEGGFIASLSLPDALRLQTFPADYPLHGGKVSRYRQVGDAMPRALADAILGAMS